MPVNNVISGAKLLLHKMLNPVLSCRCQCIQDKHPNIAANVVNAAVVFAQGHSSSTICALQLNYSSLKAEQISL